MIRSREFALAMAGVGLRVVEVVVNTRRLKSAMISEHDRM